MGILEMSHPENKKNIVQIAYTDKNKKISDKQKTPFKNSDQAQQD